MKTNYTHMLESDKILSILDLMGAISKETGVTTEEMLDKAIEEGAAKDIFTDGWHGHKEGDHPWWLLLAAMSGTGSEEEVTKYNVPHLHREKVSRKKNGRKTNVYIYWYDESYTHEVNFTGKKYQEKIQKEKARKELLERAKNLPGSKEEHDQMLSSDPDYVNISGKFVRKGWMVEHPDKARMLYGWWFVSNPDQYKEIFGEDWR